jgi:imidazolonepropionase
MATRNAPTPWDSLWIEGHLATMAGSVPYGALRDGAVGVRGGRIAWIGPQRDLPDRPDRCAAAVHGMGGAWMTPGLIDCHSHIVFAGDRVAEFELRRSGASYEEIARRGGGILATVAATRAASEEALLAQALPRALALAAEGVTTLEIKSGYGLDRDTERRMLRVARHVGGAQAQTGVGTRVPPTEGAPVGGAQAPTQRGASPDVRTTYLGAHALPPEFAGRADEYVDFMCEEVLPALAGEGLVDAVDAYRETIGFTAAQIERLFGRAREFGLPVKLHADQLSDGGGAALAARCGALSADHLEYTGAAGAAALAAAGTLAVLLPGPFYTLGETRLPPVAELRRRGVPIAIASDCNPGTSPTVSLLLMMNMACRLFGLTPEECLAGVTRSAAQALGLAADRGMLAVGQRADLALWDIGSPAELSYWLGRNPLRHVIRNGAGS